MMRSYGFESSFFFDFTPQFPFPLQLLSQLDRIQPLSTFKRKKKTREEEDAQKWKRKWGLGLWISWKKKSYFFFLPVVTPSKEGIKSGWILFSMIFVLKNSSSLTCWFCASAAFIADTSCFTFSWWDLASDFDAFASAVEARSCSARGINWEWERVREWGMFFFPWERMMHW